MAFNPPPFAPHAASEGQFSSMGVVGTLGTSDVGGTANTLPFAIDPATGAAWNKEIGTPFVIVQNGTVAQGSPAGSANAWPVKLYASDGVGLLQSGGNLLVNVQNFAVGQFGTADALAANLTSALDFSENFVFNGATWDRMRGDATNGVFVNVKAGTVVGNINTGTINVGTFVMPTGTITTGSLSNLAMINAGTLTTIGAGTQNTLGTVGVVNNLVTGTLANSGTTTGVGTITNLGSITNIGQLYNAGSVQTIIAGTQNTLGTVGVINNGTLSINLLPLPGIMFGTSGTVGTAATALPTSPLGSRKSIIIYNLGTSRIWVTGSTGIGSTGIPVGTGDYSPPFDMGTGILYAVADTAGGTVTTLEVS